MSAPAASRVSALLGASALLAVAAELPLMGVFGPPGLRLVLWAALPACLATAGAWVAGNRAFGPSDPGDPGGDGSSPVAVLGGFAAGLACGAAPGLLLAAPDPFGPASPGPRLLSALSDGWYRLLSVPTPAPFSRSFTDLPVLIAAALAAAITLCALSRRPALAMAPAVAGFGGLLVLGASGPVSGTALAGGFALAALVFLVLAAPPARGAVRRRAISGAVAGGALVAAAVLAAGALHPGTPYNPRAAMRPPVHVQVSRDPLTLIPALLQTPAAPVLTARLSGALLSHPRNWVLLTYDSYDGAGWTAPENARPAVTAAPVPAAVGTGTASVTAASAVTLLPHPAAVLGSSPAGLDYAPAQEMLAAPSPVRQYTIRVSVGVPSAPALASAAVPAGTPPQLTALPACTPTALHVLATRVAAATSLPGEQVEQLQGYFNSAPFRYDHAAAPGEGCASITSMLNARKGTSAQYATAFVLVARELGIPARVAVGYSPGHLAGGVATVTDGDAYAWAQVELTGIGWMDVDPTPKSAVDGAAPPREKQPAITGLQATPPKSAHPGKHVNVPVTPAPPAGLSLTATVALGAGVAVALVLGWLLAVLGYTARRRSRRRNAADPARRVLGAWDEALAELAMAGVPVAGHSAPSVAAGAARIVPPSARPVRELASLAERALYDSVADADADAAWHLSDQARRAATAAVGWRARLRRLFLPARPARLGRDAAVDA